jgi:hypothetical protein
LGVSSLWKLPSGSYHQNLQFWGWNRDFLPNRFLLCLHKVTNNSCKCTSRQGAQDEKHGNGVILGQIKKNSSKGKNPAKSDGVMEVAEELVNGIR